MCKKKIFRLCVFDFFPGPTFIKFWNFWHENFKFDWVFFEYNFAYFDPALRFFKALHSFFLQFFFIPALFWTLEYLSLSIATLNICQISMRFTICISHKLDFYESIYSFVELTRNQDLGLDSRTRDVCS